MAEEWYREARKRADAEALIRADVEKSLEATKQEQSKLSEKLKMADQAHSSAEVGLKMAERQAEEQRQKLHSTEIDLATQKQIVVDLQVELQKVKEEVQLAKAEKKASYQLSVEETEIRLVKELSKVCRDYCDMTWDKALTVVGFSANSALRLPRSIYYHP